MAASESPLPTNSPAVAAVRRSNQAYFEQVSRVERLDCGWAYYSQEYPPLAVCNFVGEVVLGEVDAVRMVDEFFAGRGLRCHRWIPALGQAAEPVEMLLAGHGYTLRQSLAMRFDEDSRDAGPGAGRGDGFAAKGFRILEARAMPRAYAAVLAARSREQSPEFAEALSALQLERLNDPQYTAHVALLEDRPVGMASLLQVGQIGRLCDLFVVADAREQGVATTLVRTVVRTARRWALRPICAQVEAEANRSLTEANQSSAESDVDAKRSFAETQAEAKRSFALLERAGFVADGTIAELVRPGAANSLP